MTPPTENNSGKQAVYRAVLKDRKFHQSAEFDSVGEDQTDETIKAIDALLTRQPK